MNDRPSQASRRDRDPAPDVAARLRSWHEAGLIDTGQLTDILEFERSGHTATLTASRYGRLLTIIGALGAVLIGVGVILFVGSNWQGIPGGLKLAMLIALVTAAYGAGWALRYKAAYPRLGSSLMLLGAFAYGAAIFLVGQAYHMPLDDPNLMLLWLLPLPPIAYLTRSGAMLLLAVAVGYGALGYRIATWVDVGRTPLVVPAVYLAVGAVLLAVGYAHERIPRLEALAGPYRVAGAATSAAFLFVMSFRGWYDFGSTGSNAALPASLLVALGAAVLSCAAALLTATRTEASSARSALEIGATIVLLAVAALLAASPAAPSVVYFAILNLALVLFISWLIAVGLLRGRATPVNVGVAVFAVTIVARYLEIGLGMMGTSMSFLVTGAVLTLLAYVLERGRRGLVSTLEAGRIGHVA